MRICVLNDPTWDAPFDPSPYLGDYDWELHDIHFDDVRPRLTELAARGFDVFMNMCDAAEDEPDRPGLEVVQTLETLNVPYTGANPDFYEPTRDAMKQVCRAQGILSPPGFTIHSPEHILASMDGLHYPLIVKHPQSYASVGLTRESRVVDYDHLCEQVTRNVGLFKGALVEEFIEGREFSVLVSENPDEPATPVTYVPIEILFPPGETFKHEEMKWRRYAEMSCNPVTDLDLAARLREISARLFLGLNGAGYGRCDVRMSESGELYMLEINPQGAVFYPPDEPGMADYILRFDPRGHKGFVDLLLRAAIARNHRKNGLRQ